MYCSLGMPKQYRSTSWRQAITRDALEGRVILQFVCLLAWGQPPESLQQWQTRSSGFSSKRGVVGQSLIGWFHMPFLWIWIWNDSVQREVLWRVMEKCGVPPKLLSIIKYLHEGMWADVWVGSMTTECLDVRNGLRQGCTLAPTLFNIYISTVVANWRRRHVEAGVNVLYKHGRNW